jgi:uncharacterized membrane protein
MVVVVVVVMVAVVVVVVVCVRDGRAHGALQRHTHKKKATAQSIQSRV